MTLDQFEALVQSQKPASQPWQPVTDYSFEARKAAEGKNPELILDTFKPRTLLDYGAGYGILVRLLEDEQPVWAHAFYAYDPDLAPRCINVIYREDLQRHWSKHFDLVICREVLEHLTIKDVKAVVSDLCRLSSRFVYVTTRFHPQPCGLLDVATSDDLDPTHITLLNQDFLRVLFVLEGFKRRADLEQRMDWQQKGRVLVYERAA